MSPSPCATSRSASLHNTSEFELLIRSSPTVAESKSLLLAHHSQQQRATHPSTHDAEACSDYRGTGSASSEASHVRRIRSLTPSAAPSRSSACASATWSGCDIRHCGAAWIAWLRADCLHTSISHTCGSAATPASMSTSTRISSAEAAKPFLHEPNQPEKTGPDAVADSHGRVHRPSGRVRAELHPTYYISNRGLTRACVC